MTSSPPPPFDDGGELPETSAHQPAMRRARQPNYLIRRAIAIGVVVVVLAGASVMVGRIIGSDDGGDARTPVSADWNTIVVLTDDEVRLVEPDTGEVTDTYPAQEPLLDAESLVTGHTLVTMNDFGRITELDLRDGAIRRSSASEGSILQRETENTSIVLAGLVTGGDVAVVDTRDGPTFDIGAVAGLADPLMFVTSVLVNRSGSHVATADARTFQSVLVAIEDQTPFLLAGQVVALDDETVVTAQRAGERAELEFYDLEGERRGSAAAPAPQATMLTGPTTALVVSPSGAIAAVAADGSVDELGAIDESVTGDAATVQVRGGVAAMESTRLVVTTDDEVVLLDMEGAILASAPGELLTETGRVSKCALVGSARPAGSAVHIDLETGAVLGEVAGGVVLSSSSDGCTLSMVGEESLIVVGGVERGLGVSRGSATIAPDGSMYVLSTPSGQQLVAIDDGEGDPPEPVDLATASALVRFAEI